MYWMYAGYLVPYFVAFAVIAAEMLPNHPYPGWGAFAAFVLWPAMVIGTSAWIVVEPTKERESIHLTMCDGRLSRVHVVGAGVFAGVLAIATVVGIWQATQQVFDSLGWIRVVLIGLIVMFVPAFAAAWLAKVAESRSSRSA